MKFSPSNLLPYVLLLVVPLVIANPISTNIEEAKSGVQDPSFCWQCFDPRFCSWKGFIVPCNGILSSGQIVEASTGLVIGSLNSTSILPNGTILLKDPITPDLQPQAMGGLPDSEHSELVEVRTVAGDRDQEDSESSAPRKQLERRHDYVLNCGDNNGPRYRRCSSYPYNYYCKRTGALDNKGNDSLYCDEWCECQKIYIKYCPLGNSPLVNCIGISTSELPDPTNTTGYNQTTPLPNDTSPSDNGNKTTPNREVSEVLQSEVEIVAPGAATEVAALKKRHGYALGCASGIGSLQKDCSNLGYFCTSTGVVKALHEGRITCGLFCKCRIFPKREISEALQPEVDLVAPEPTAEPAALAKRHNYALDCISATAAVQKECKDLGYYFCATRSANVGLYGNCFVTQWDYVSCVGVHGKDVTGKQDQVAGGFVAQIVNGTSVRLNNGTVLNNVQWD